MRNGKATVVGVSLCLAGLFTCADARAQTENAERRVASLEARVRALEARMATAEARIGEHEMPDPSHAAHTGRRGMQGAMPDQPMGQMPPHNSMPPQPSPQQGMPMGGGMGGMGDM